MTRSGESSKLEHIAVASDGSEVARGAYLVARDMADPAGARISVVGVVAGHRVRVGAYRERSDEEHTRLKTWVSTLDVEDEPPEVEVRFGHPSIEIPRYAETHAADLLVLGRSPRSQADRFRAGDTADAVVRRSTVPCLLVPHGTASPRHLLAAVDGTPRGKLVLSRARELARAAGMSCRALTVAPGQSVCQQVLEELRETGADLLAIGVRRGGPPGMLELGSIGRHLAHVAPCAVLTIPL